MGFTTVKLYISHIFNNSMKRTKKGKKEVLSHI